MYLTVIAGETGTGKSTIAKEIIKQSPFCCAYDIQNEYDLPYYERGGVPPEKFRVSPRTFDIGDFINIIKNSNGYTFVIEEATGIFKGTGGKAFIKEVLSKRHSKNNFIIIFHALHRIPPDIFEFIDVLIMFKTGDLLMNIKSKYPDYVEKFLYLQDSNKKVTYGGNPNVSEFFVIKKSNLSKK